MAFAKKRGLQAAEEAQFTVISVKNIPQGLKPAFILWPLRHG
jgi:hypothetical protein